MRPQRFSLYQDKRTGHWIVRFSHGGRRYGLSSGTTDREEAARAARGLMAGVLGDRPRRVVVASGSPLRGDGVARVYVIQAGPGGPVKIGHTTDVPDRRLATLQTGNPTPLRLVGWMEEPGSRQFERMVHEALADYRMEGEWFRCSRPVAEMAADIATEGELGRLLARLVEWLDGCQAVGAPGEVSPGALP